MAKRVTRGGTVPRRKRPDSTVKPVSPIKKPKPAPKPKPTPSSPTTISATSGTDPDQVRGRVVGYTIGADGLVVKLDVSAIYRLAFSVGANEPHFRAAVSMTMLALSQRINPNAREDGFDQQFLWVWLKQGTKKLTIRPAVAVAASYNTDANPFDIDSFVFSPDDI